MTGNRGTDPAGRRPELDALSSFSGKWDPVVVLCLRDEGPLGFNALLESIPDISGKVLSDTLETLAERDLIERRVLSETPLRVEYDLTPAGRDLDPVFEALAAWAKKHLESTPTVLVADADHRLTELYGRWLGDYYDVERAHGAGELDSRDLDSIDAALVADNLPGADVESLLSTFPSHCRTVLLLGDRPGLDILDTPCDDLLRKPIVRSTILEVVDEQLSRRGEPEDERQRAATAAKRTVLETVRSADFVETATDPVSERSDPRPPVNEGEF